MANVYAVTDSARQCTEYVDPNSLAVLVHHIVVQGGKVARVQGVRYDPNLQTRLPIEPTAVWQAECVPGWENMLESVVNYCIEQEGCAVDIFPHGKSPVSRRIQS
ncbi:MAG: hypothetical protein KJ601_07335 [Nanoarchaeota archaeon]|nr:hypothetical protein [Nanoarchaeota archaeon]